MQQTSTILTVGQDHRRIPANNPGEAPTDTVGQPCGVAPKQACTRPWRAPIHHRRHRIARPTPHTAVCPSPPRRPLHLDVITVIATVPPPPPPDVLNPPHQFRRPPCPALPPSQFPRALLRLLSLQPLPSPFACTMPAALTSAAMTDDGGPSAEELRREFGPNLPDDVLYECTFSVAALGGCSRRSLSPPSPLPARPPAYPPSLPSVPPVAAAAGAAVVDRAVVLHPLPPPPLPRRRFCGGDCCAGDRGGLPRCGGGGRPVEHDATAVQCQPLVGTGCGGWPSVPLPWSGFPSTVTDGPPAPPPPPLSFSFFCGFPLVPPFPPNPFFPNRHAPV